VLQWRRRQAPFPARTAYWVVRSPRWAPPNFAAGIPYWAISLARFGGGRSVLAILMWPAPRQRIRWSIAGQVVGQRQTDSCGRPPQNGRSIGCASALAGRSIGVLQKLAGSPRFRHRFASAGCGQPQFWSAWPWGRTVGALEATRRFWDLAPTCLVALRVGLPFALVAEQSGSPEPGAEPRRTGFSCAERQGPSTLDVFMPWVRGAASRYLGLVGCGSGRLGCSLCSFSDCAGARARLQNENREEGASQRCLVGFKSG